MKKLEEIKHDVLIKSRHSGENRSPDGLQLLEETGFAGLDPGSAGITENGILGLFTRP